MQRFEIYRPGVFCVFILVVMFAVPSTTLGQAEDEQAGEAEDPATPASETASRSLVWTGSGERALNQAFPEAAVWLQLEEGDRALGLFYPEARLPARGAVLILSDEGETAASGVTGTLAAGLAARGWAALSLGLESPSPVLNEFLMRPVVEPPAAEAGADQGASSDSVMIDVMASAESVDDLEARYRSRINQTLQAGLALLRERGYEAPAIVGVGRASIYVTNRLLEGGEADALVWVAPRFYPADRPDLPERLASLGTELLELYPSGAVDADADWSMGMRLRRAGLSGFERQPIPWMTPAPESLGDGVASRVAAWLESRER